MRVEWTDRKDRNRTTDLSRGAGSQTERRPRGIYPMPSQEGGGGAVENRSRKGDESRVNYEEGTELIMEPLTKERTCNFSILIKI